MTTTKINPRQMEVGPLPEEEPPPMVAGGQVWKNGFLVDGGIPYAVAPAGARPEVISLEEFHARRRQREAALWDAAASGDPALLYALLTWALRHPDAPSHADLEEWMEEGRQRFAAAHAGAFVAEVPDVAEGAETPEAEPPAPKKGRRAE